MVLRVSHADEPLRDLGLALMHSLKAANVTIGIGDAIRVIDA